MEVCLGGWGPMEDTMLPVLYLVSQALSPKESPPIGRQKALGFDPVDLVYTKTLIFLIDFSLGIIIIHTS